MAIDFNKVRQNVASKAEPIPVSNLKPPASKPAPEITAGAPNTPPAQQKVSSSPGRPNKGLNRNYTRVGFDNDVWQAMKYKKLMGDESFTDQINNALRLYLGIKTKP